jgi:flavin reductase (DIM6/NTAB) family NADH-FMN oxidoreductase RutF
MLYAEGTAMIVDPAAASPQNVYKLLIGLVVPRPIAFVSTVAADGVLNLAPFSFFTVASANPPVVAFCPMIPGSGAGRRKDTLRNVEETGEFVLNIVSEDFAAQMNTTSGEYPPEVDEFALSGLTPLPSDLVKPPRVGESRAQMECKLLQVVHVSANPLGGSLVLGEVLRFHLADEIFDDFRIDPDKLLPVGRMGGASYCRTHDRFAMERPKG